MRFSHGLESHEQSFSEQPLPICCERETEVMLRSRSCFLAVKYWCGKSSANLINESQSRNCSGGDSD
jgi:hypothetical protein